MPVRLAVLLALVAVALASVTGSPAAEPPRVTLIGDSSAYAVRLHDPARARLARGISLRLELAVCRRLARVSCVYEGARPQSLVELARSQGAGLGRTVIVALGYNDDPGQYVDDIPAALATLREVGVTRILWVTLHATNDGQHTVNRAIRDAAARNADVTLVDWDRHSNERPDWFQPDEVHLTDRGAMAMAGLFHEALAELGVPLAGLVVVVPAPRALQSAKVGSRLALALRAAGGTPPYRWSLAGPRPAGLAVDRAGRLTWRPRTAGAFAVTVRVTDARGQAATRVLRLASR